MKYVTGLPKIEYVDCDDPVDAITDEQAQSQMNRWLETHPDWWTQEKRRINKERRLYKKDLKRLNLK